MKKINKLGFIRTSKYIGIFLELIITAYDCYDDLYWEDQWQKGEPLVHYLIQIGEIAGSVKIIQQTPEGIPRDPMRM